ncbi:hypothetical protein WDW37_08545 [Bdellovibrionota bacterium FG-1]
MGRAHRNGSLRKKVDAVQVFPQILVDAEADFASIKLAPGIEAKSYAKDGFVFCEDKKGRVIEVQVLNLSELHKKKHEDVA